MKPPFQLVETFRDPSPNGIINLRLIATMMQISEQTDFTSPEKQQFLTLLMFVGKKMVATWNHFNAYNLSEDKLIKVASEGPAVQNQPVVRYTYAQDLFIEFDEFLVQIKSGLDCLVKIPSVVIGKNKWNLTTFGGHGDKVIKSIERNFPRNLEEQGKAIISIVQRHQPWLDASISARDMTNHLKDGGIDYKAFIVFKNIENEKEVIRVPMFTADTTLRQFIQATWYNFFSLVEEFIGAFLGIRLPANYGLLHDIVEPDSVKSPFRVINKDDWEAIEAFMKAQGNSQ